MKVAIVGGEVGSEYLAPFEDPKWEIWVLGNQMGAHENRRVSRMFEIHDDLTEHDSGYPKWLAAKNTPMVVGRGFPIEAPHITVYPFDEVNSIMGEHLTSSPAYMMGMAILEGATEIGIYGIDMSIDDHEYFYQRSTMYGWIGYARGLGIKITIPQESNLFVDTYVEGRESGGKPELETPPFTEAQFLAMSKVHSNKIKECVARIESEKTLISTHNGADQAYKRLAKVARATELGIDITSLSDSAVIK
jgi:hypothetical protein